MRAITIGTVKGGYVLDDSGRVLSGPHFPGWKVTAWGTTGDGATLAALASNWFGTSVQRSRDLEDWEQLPDGPSYEDGRSLDQIWTLHTTDTGTILAGVDEAGLFRSDDAGESWEPVPSLNDWPSRNRWMPGLGGLCAHHVITIGDRWWVGISAVGVFRSDDAGATFVEVDDGVTPAAEPTEETDAGTCVHSIAVDPGRPDAVWRQDHSGVYRTVNAGEWWDRIEHGLPARFGFPIRRDDASGRLFVVPLESDGNRVAADGRFRVYRSDDDGDSWGVSGTGWPDHPSFDTVLRNAMAADGDGALALGTTGGDVWLTHDAGDTWTQADLRLPRILNVSFVA